MQLTVCYMKPVSSAAAGSVLVFLPNWQAIADVYEALLQDVALAQRLQLFVLHSLLPMQEQQEAFTHVPPGGLLAMYSYMSDMIVAITLC
jgi:HrpA-like RNA helicase